MNKICRNIGYYLAHEQIFPTLYAVSMRGLVSVRFIWKVYIDKPFG